MRRILLFMSMCIATMCVACTSIDDTAKTPAQEQDKDIRILAIGNSFSVDAMQYLYGILEDAGYEDIVLGNIYKGGCSLEQHSNRFENDNGNDYTYYKNTTGEWTGAYGCFPRRVLQEEEWDYVVMQQVSGKSGQSDTYEPYLSELLEIVTSYCPDASLAWHMTWAYQGNSAHNDFKNYDSDQMTMYNAIVSTVRNTVMSKGVFTKVIPNGTAVQNLRTSYIGDNLTRDGYHMSYDKGRYLTALTFAKVLTGCDLSAVEYTPSDQNYTAKEVAAMKEAAENACKTPYSVTVSSYQPDSAVDNTQAAVSQLVTNAGYNPDDFTRLELSMTRYAYYNSTNAQLVSTLYTEANKNMHRQNNCNQFVATKIFAKTEIPAGSLVVIRDGFQYRPEAWTALDAANTSDTRPDNVTANVTKITDSWWGDWNFRAFNIAKSGRPVLNEATAAEVCNSFAVFVPTPQGTMISSDGTETRRK